MGVKWEWGGGGGVWGGGRHQSGLILTGLEYDNNQGAERRACAAKFDVAGNGMNI